ncbi:MAG: DNA mismatch repair endonuclease MutL [Thiohalomonadaceae bacterium]
MQRRIHTLSPQLANQIAAGEVVERPASVAKELLENSIDAGARRIDLELEQGGLKLLRVSDDGSGIHPQDLPLALAQHATSKIYTQAELAQIASLGFRGEALASIASVSRFQLCSYYPGEDHAWQIDNQTGGKHGTAKACALDTGTRIEVCDLFYNMPARRKFMRSERTEYLHVEEVLRRLALSRFDIAFSLSHNGRAGLRLRPAKDEAGCQQRIGELLGRGFIASALKLDMRAAGMRLWGWISPPEQSLSQSSNQYFYLNGRVIRDKLVSHALRQAQLNVLEAGRHPAYVLYLEMDPAQVDINVHPTKHEVRFRQTRLVHDFLQRAVSETLAQTPGQTEAGTDISAGHSGTDAYPKAAPGRLQVADTRQFYQQAAGLRPAGRAPAALDTRGLSILYGRFALRQTDGQLALLDINVLRRLLWSAQLRQDEVVSVPLLVPEVLRLDEAQCLALMQLVQDSPWLGLMLDRLGPGELVVRARPPWMQGMSMATLLPRLLQWDGCQPESLLELLLPLAPAPELTQLAESLQRAEAQGLSIPWRSLSAETLQRWLQE